MKNRDISLDIIRIMACCMIVFMHAPMPSDNASGMFLTGLSYFTAPGIGLFFMVSGALLMPVNCGYFTFIRRRLSKIVLPTLAWTAIYLTLHIYFSSGDVNLLQAVLSVPFSAQGHGVLWFMYTLTGIYLLAPVLSAWTRNASAREIEFILLLWCVTLCYPLLENRLSIDTGNTGILYYFTGYAGYFLLGYYLKNHCGRMRLWLPAAVSVTGICLLLFLKGMNVEFDFYRLFWYESVFVAAMCCAAWILVVKAAGVLMRGTPGGYRAVYQQIIQCEFWRLPNPHPRHALLPLESGVDKGNIMLSAADRRGGCHDTGCQHGTLSYDVKDSTAERPLPGIPAKKVKPRLYYIDNLRVLACFLVLLTHSTMPGKDPASEGVWMYTLSFIGSPSSELFLALSGTVLLPVKTGFGQFYRRRFKKLLPPLFIWSVLGVILHTQINTLSWSQAWDKIIHIPLQPAIGVYWFVYAMAGLYLFAPFISPWLRGSSKRQLEIFLGLWAVNMIIPWIEFFAPGFISDFSINGNYYWTLCHFGGFLGYWILGYYLNRYPIAIGFNRKWILLLILTCAYPALILVLKVSGEDVSVLTDNLQLGSALILTLLYTVMQNVRLSPSLQRRVSDIAKYSFGIYLTHIYIARDLYWGLFENSTIHILPRTFIIALLTLLTGYLLTRLLSMIPKGRYITGA